MWKDLNDSFIIVDENYREETAKIASFWDVPVDKMPFVYLSDLSFSLPSRFIATHT